MYQAIPGCSHLKTLRTPHTSTDVAPPSPKTLTPDIRALIHVALEATFGMRDPMTLPLKRFDARVRTHILANLRGSTLRGRPRILRLDAQPAPVPLPDPADALAVRMVAALEAVGSCMVLDNRGHEHRKAFACRLEQTASKRQWVMKSYRIF